MRTVATLILASLAMMASAQEKALIKFSPKIDSKVVHAMEMKIAVAGTDAIVKANLNSTITGMKDDLYDYKAEFKDFSVDVGGSNPGVEASELKAKLAKNGALSSIEGGIQGNDAARIFLLLQFIAPEKELNVGESFTMDVAERKEGGVPGYKFEGKYLGTAEVEGLKGFKFETKLTETGDGLSSTGTFIVSGEGVVLSADVKFKNLPIPIVGQSVEGTITAKIKP
jgi:hypothetical protein